MEEHVILYHGTDVKSGLDILNNGLNAKKLLMLQTGHLVQIRTGWYVALDPKVAWFFASLAPGDRGQGYTVLKIHLKTRDLDKLFNLGLAKQSVIYNVPFAAEQIWFNKASFEFLNTNADFSPYREKIGNANIYNG